MRAHALACALLAALALGPLSQAAPQQPAALVSDLTEEPAAPGFSLDSGFVGGATAADVGGALLFSAWSEPTGSELWRSDGTPGGTVLVRDIYPGANSSSIGWMTVVDGVAYFSADDGSYGQELWRSDGTTAGTWRVADGLPGDASLSPTELVAVGGTLLFSASGPSDADLWRSDGTAAGTRRVKGGFLHPPYARLRASLTAVGQRVFFTAFEPISPYGGYRSRLWVSDGSEAGTVALPSPPPVALLAAGELLVFSAGSAASGELWVSGGTPASTRALMSSPGTIDLLGALGGQVYFTITASDTGSAEVWRTDGSPGGTESVAPLGAAGVTAHAALGSSLVLFLYDEARARASIWRSDGTQGGSGTVRELDWPAFSVAALGGQLLFPLRPIDGSVPSALWRTDGTAQGTQAIATLPIAPTLLGAAGRRLYMDLSAGLWASDGTPGGTGEVRGGSFAPGSSPISLIEPTLDGAYLAVDRPPMMMNGAVWFDLYRSDATAAGTTLAGSFVKDDGLGYGGSFTALGPALVFGTADGSGEPNGLPGRLWRADAAGVAPLADIPVWSAVTVGERVIFSGGPFFDQSLWASDGTAAGTQRVSEIACETVNCSVRIGPLAVAGGRVWIDALLDLDCCHNTHRYRSELWVSDGTVAGTRLVKRFAEVIYHPIHFPWSLYSLAGLTPYGAGVAFTARESGDYNALWVSDGTAAGTRALAATPQREEDMPEALTVVGGRLFFSMGDAAHGRELWLSDGTPAGTHLLADTLLGAGGSGPRELTSVGGALLFSANDGAHGRELWVSDGTAAGTRMLRDIVPGADGSNPSELAAIGGMLLFSAADEAGVEPWRSDGTAAGTQRMQDIAPGPASSNPAMFTLGGGHLFFVADDGAHGRELWGVHTESAVYGEVARLHLPLVGR